MDRRELDRYKYVLLAKRGELSVQNADGEVGFQLQEAGMVIRPTKPMLMPKQSCRSSCIKLMVVS